MGVALTEAEGASLISLEGAIDIARAVELRTVLVAALKEGRQLRVCLDEAAELDVTAFQLLWAAGREAAQKSIECRAVQAELPRGGAGDPDGAGIGASRAERNPRDTELVSRIFRGLHTIKGSGAMFGFERLAAFMHDLETAFDLVRSGRHGGQRRVDRPDPGRARSDSFHAGRGTSGAGAGRCCRLRRHSRASASWRAIEERLGEERCGSRAKKMRPKNEPAPAPAAAPAGAIENWHIRFAPGPDLMRTAPIPLAAARVARVGRAFVRASSGRGACRSAKWIPSGATSGGRWIWPRVRAGRRFAMSSFLSKTRVS
jgi:hypothetical protein